MSHFEVPKYFECFCSLDKDKDLLNIKDMKYLPWIGVNYFQQDRRILVIGESIYNYNTDTSTDAKQAEILRRLNHMYQVRAIVKEHGLNFLCGEHGVPDKKKSPVKNFGKIYYNKPYLTDDEKLAIWKNIAFHEFIQTPLISRNDRQDVNKKNVQLGFEVIKEMIKILGPDYIIFSGVSCLEHLKDNLDITIAKIKNKEKVSPREGFIKQNKLQIPFIAVKHFSYFSYSLHNVINENFKKHYQENVFNC